MYLRSMPVSGMENRYRQRDLDVPIVMEQPTYSGQESAMPVNVGKLITYVYGAE